MRISVNNGVGLPLEHGSHNKKTYNYTGVDPKHCVTVKVMGICGSVTLRAGIPQGTLGYRNRIIGVAKTIS